MLRRIARVPGFGVGVRRYSIKPSLDHVSTKLHSNYAVITIHKPKVNALDGPLLKALSVRVKELEDNPSIKGAIITGLPGVFSAGLDIPVLSKHTRGEFEEFYDVFTENLRATSMSRLIMVSAISGHAPAGGAVLSLTTDYRIAQEGKFKIGLNEAAVGIPLPPGVAELFTSVVGQRKALNLALHGALISPQEALACGLVDEVVPQDQLMPRAQHYLENLFATTHEKAVRETKQLLKQNLDKAFDFQKADAKTWIDHWFLEETQQGFAAFLATLGKK